MYDPVKDGVDKSVQSVRYTEARPPDELSELVHSFWELMKDPTDSNVQMKAFPTDIGVYGAGGALVQREGANPGIGGTTVYFGVEDCSIEESRVSDAGGQNVGTEKKVVIHFIYNLKR